MIRIDESVAQDAKSLDLNFSKICEEALTHAVQEETRPYEITKSNQIVFDLNLYCDKTLSKLGLNVNIINASEENVIFDRLTYMIFIQPARQSELTDPVVQKINGAILERRTVSKGRKESFIEPVMGNFDPTKITRITDEPLAWRVFPQLIVESKRGILSGRFEQELDDRGFARARPLQINGP